MTRTRAVSAIIRGIITILVLIIIVVIANFLTYYTSNPSILKIVSFLNSNLVLLIATTILFFIGDALYHLKFPIDLASPPFDAIGSVFVAAFLINALILLDTFINTGISLWAQRLKIWIYIIVFVIVLITGYLSIISRLSRIEKRKGEYEEIEEIEEEPIKTKRKRVRRIRRVRRVRRE